MPKINDLILSVYRDFGFDEFVVKLSTLPQSEWVAMRMWDHAEEVMAGC